MNFSKVLKSFDKILEAMGGGWVAILIGILVVALIVYLIYRSGKQIKFKIPFLPASIGTIKIGKSDVDKMAAAKNPEGGAEQNTAEVLGNLLREIDGLSGSAEKIYELPVYLILSQYSKTFDLATDIGGDVLQKLSLGGGSAEAGGYCVVTDRGILLYHDNPDEIVRELLAIRPERPLDGVIFAVPMTHLNEANKASSQARIDWYFKAFWDLQQGIEFTLPVYLVIPGMETISGFDDFWNNPFAQQYQDNILGWSNPKMVASEKIEDSVGLAFDGVVRDSRKILFETVSQTQVASGPEALAFLAEFSRVRSRAMFFFAGIFDQNPLGYPYYLRGIYFSGQLAKDDVWQHKFIHELFHRKIFLEANLAAPRVDRLLSSSQRLKNVQYASVGLFAVMSLWLAADLYGLYQKNLGLRSASEQIRYVWSGTRGYEAVNTLVDILARTDASYDYCCGPVPLSVISPTKSQLETFFQEDVFGNAIFPIMECRNRQLLQEHTKDSLFAFDNALLDGDFSDWLNTVESDMTFYGRLQHKIETTEALSQVSVAQDFSELVDYLFGEEVPAAFFGSKAELYLSAMSDHSYRIEKIGAEACPRAVQAPGVIWDKLIAASSQQIIAEQRKQAAPLAFIENVSALASMSLDQVKLDSASLANYLQWHAHFESEWEAGYTFSFCGRTAQSLGRVAKELARLDDGDAKRQSAIAGFEGACVDAMAVQFERDNARLPRDLYSQIKTDDILAPRVSVVSEEVFDFIDEMGDLSFTTASSSSLPTLSPDGTDFYWSVDELKTALSYIDEYKNFAQNRFPSLALPEGNPSLESRKTYLTQAIALAQLQRSLLVSIDAARTEMNDSNDSAFRTIDGREADIAHRVANFKKALNPLLALISGFEQFGFTSARSKLLSVSHAHAALLLREVDGLYHGNHVFAPRASLSWQAHAYPEAFFGLVSESQIKDYFTAQSQRSRFLAQEYAEPLVAFLRNTNGDFSAPDLISRWSHTLVEINKQQNKNPANEVEAFQQFLIGAFAQTNLSNCHEKTKTYGQPIGNSLFAVRYRELANAAIGHCQKFRADAIEAEYAEVRGAFNDLLALYFPFNTSPGARALPVRQLRQFMKVYPGRSNGLAERVRVLAWKYPNFEQAESFVRQLDQSLLLFDQVFALSSTADPIGLEIVAELGLEVLENPAQSFRNHISDVTLRVGNAITKQQQAKSLYWNIGDPMSLSINWAAGSPYRASKSGQAFRSNRIEYKEDDSWSLLRLINSHRSRQADQQALSGESILLQFELEVALSEKREERAQTTQFARVTIFGMDPETKERIPLLIPERFPLAPPIMKKG